MRTLKRRHKCGIRRDGSGLINDMSLENRTVLKYRSYSLLWYVVRIGPEYCEKTPPPF